MYNLLARFVSLFTQINVAIFTQIVQGEITKTKKN